MTKPHLKTVGYYPAFPTTDEYGDAFDGLSKRELFAAMAMQGMTARDEGYPSKQIVHDAVLMSDLLIEELNRTRQSDA